MLEFIFDDVNDLVKWLDNHVKEYHEQPRITGKIIKGEKIFTAYVSL